MSVRWAGYGESDGCLGVPSLIARVEDHLGRRSFDTSSPDVLSVTVEMPPGGGFRAAVRLLDATGQVIGERDLVTRESSCGALDDPLVLAVALLVDAGLGTEPPPEPEPVIEPPLPEPPEPEPPAPPRKSVVPDEPPRPPDPWRISVDSWIFGTDGSLPELAIGMELGLQVDAPWFFPVRIRAAGLVPQQVELVPEGSLDLALALGGVSVCPLSVPPEPVGLFVCAGGDLLMQHAVSEGIAGARSDTEWFVQGALMLRGEVALRGPWFLEMATYAGVPLRAPEFVYRRSGDKVSVFRMADVTLTAGLGIGVRLMP
jgi:hypothetical protein